MTTPICDFVRRYEALRPIRLHMPGHKQGTDITEIPGADVLYAAEGIIRESEENAAALFQSRRTLYSAEGSSLCIRAMLYLAQMHAALQGRRARIAEWIGESGSLLQCRVDPNALEDLFRSPETAPTAVYLTTPDYLGNRTDLQPIAGICHRHGALLLADNAHGAYLRFLPEGEHPLTRGADLCCDSAHKTLPAPGACRDGGARHGPVCEYKSLLSDPCLAGCSEPPAGGGLPCQDSGDRRPGRENENGADSKGLAPCRDRAAEADACTEVIRMAERRPGGSFEGKQHLL